MPVSDRSRVREPGAGAVRASERPYHRRMSPAVDNLLGEAMALSADDRADLAVRLLDSLGGADEDADAVEAAWQEELARRVEEHQRTGEAEPWGVVRERLRADLQG